MGTRSYRLYLFYLVCLLPFVVFGAVVTLESNQNSPLDWVSSEFPARAAFDRFRERFGSGDLLIAGWPSCRIDSEALDQIESSLRCRSVFFSGDGTWYFDHVVSGRDLLRQTEAAFGRAEAEALRQRLARSWIGEDGQSTILVVSFTKDGLERRGRLVELVKAVIHREAQIPYADIHLAGPVMDGLSVDRASQRSLHALALPSSAVVLLLSWLFLRTLRGAAVILGVATLAQMTTLALVYYGGGTMNALLIVLPPLVQVLSIAGGLHLTHYYRSHEGPRTEAALQAVRIGWLPCILSGGTTALGIASLAGSGLEPIRSFALFGSLGVLLSTALVLSLVPGLLALAHVPPLAHGDGIPNAQAGRGWNRLSAFLERRGAWVVAVFLIGMAVAGMGTRRLSTSVRIETLFAPGSRILADYQWLEERVGSLVPIEVLLEWNETESDWDRQLALIGALEKAIAELPDVDATISARTWLPKQVLDVPTSAIDERQRATWTEATMRAVEDARYLSGGSKQRTLRITAFVSAVKPLDYAAALDQVQNVVTRTLSEHAGGPPPQKIFTGTMPLVHAIQRRLLADLFRSFLGALILVTIVMTLVQGGMGAGLVVMLPNLFPIVIVFGLLGWKDQPLDIGSVMTASVAIGIAVDDTIHFLTAYHRSREQGRSASCSVIHAYHLCGRAMFQTSAVCGLGMLIFALSDFVPTRRFAWMMAVQLGLALLGDLILLPALLLASSSVRRPPHRTETTSRHPSVPVFPRRRRYPTHTHLPLSPPSPHPS